MQKYRRRNHGFYISCIEDYIQITKFVDLYPPMDHLHHYKFRAWSTIMEINLRMKDKFIDMHK
ncbi:hypothetical protein MtrunA17_Chr3g0119121 [Medicago truncatula]|uniref:Uncharacterized protein n=1 Tax=Medicago truncatula TaxID=3880 RepID=A0A396IWV0_MEDTR|nr:hypothetical protein MtrunA17_Chr3g0119121 [Medicago truncatula]